MLNQIIINNGGFSTQLNAHDFISNFKEEILFLSILVGIFMIWALTRYLILQNLKANANDSTHFNFLTLMRALIQTIIFLSIGTCPATLLDSTDGAGLKTSYLFSVERHPYFWSSESGESIYVMLEDESLNGESDRISENNLTHEDFKATRNGIILSKASPTCESKVDEFAPDCLPRGLFYKNPAGACYGRWKEIDRVNHGFMPICVENVPMQNNNTWVELKLESNLNVNNDETVVAKHKSVSTDQPTDKGRKSKDPTKPDWVMKYRWKVMIMVGVALAFYLINENEEN